MDSFGASRAKILAMDDFTDLVSSVISPYAILINLYSCYNKAILHLYGFRDCIYILLEKKEKIKKAIKKKQ